MDIKHTFTLTGLVSQIETIPYISITQLKLTSIKTEHHFLIVSSDEAVLVKTACTVATQLSK